MSKKHLEEYSQVRVLVTGHTGFKGSWLLSLLISLGAEVHGISLAPTNGSLFSRLDFSTLKSNHFIDICDEVQLSRVVRAINPNLIFHLAAQPLVRDSYRKPVETFRINVMGTANILECAIKLKELKGVIVTTTDKVYKNLDSLMGYSEDDPMFGQDPYSASKVATEMVVQSWRSLSEQIDNRKFISVRSGNVIGGGDVSRDRIMPDIVRAFTAGEKIVLRSPDAVRPWQHVLDPLWGYLLVGSRLLNLETVSETYNFGPNSDAKLTVRELTEIVSSYWPKNPGWTLSNEINPFHESKLLWLDSTRARSELKWRSVLTAKQSVKWTVEWERSAAQGEAKLCLNNQIARYKDLL